MIRFIDKKRLNVSAIIPTYNGEAFIAETINSLLNQTLELSEIIILDDNSNDNTYSIVKNIAKASERCIRVYSLSENYGPSAIRNLGMELAKEKWVLFMDHDDIAQPQLLELEYKRLKDIRESNESCILVHSAYSQINSEGEFISGICRWKQVGSKEVLGYEFVRNNILTNSGVLLDKKIALSVGGFDINLKYSQDWDLWLKLAQKGGFGYVDEPLVRVRRHSENTSKKVKNFVADEKKILKKYDISFIEKAILRRDLSWEKNKLDLMSIFFRIDCWEKGFKILKEIIEKNPYSTTAFFYLGLYYLKQKCLDEAISSFETVIKYDDKHGAALNNLGAILALQDNKEKAKKYFCQAVSIFPNYIDASFNLKNLDENRINSENIRFTWRELRPILLSYTE